MGFDLSWNGCVEFLQSLIDFAGEVFIDFLEQLFEEGFLGTVVFLRIIESLPPLSKNTLELLVALPTAPEDFGYALLRFSWSMPSTL